MFVWFFFSFKPIVCRSMSFADLEGVGRKCGGWWGGGAEKWWGTPKNTLDPPPAILNIPRIHLPEICSGSTHKYVLWNYHIFLGLVLKIIITCGYFKNPWWETAVQTYMFAQPNYVISDRVSTNINTWYVKSREAPLTELKISL